MIRFAGIYKIIITCHDIAEARFSFTATSRAIGEKITNFDDDNFITFLDFSCIGFWLAAARLAFCLLPADELAGASPPRCF